MNNFISFISTNYFTSDFLSMLIDTSIKTGVIITLVLLICNFRKRLSSELKHLLLFSSICSSIVLPLIFRLLNTINFSSFVANVGNSSSSDQSPLITNTINDYSTSKFLNIKPLNITYISTNSEFNWTGYIFLLWSLIFIFLLFRLAIGLYGTRRIFKRSDEISQPLFMTLKERK